MHLTSLVNVLCLHAEERGLAAGRRWMTLSRSSLLAFICVPLLAHASAVAPPFHSVREPDDGYVWLTVGDVDNIKFEGYFGWFAGRGSVLYEYRIAQSEVLTAQHLEFVQAYWPFYDGDPLSEHFTGMFITGWRQGNGYVYESMPGWEDAPNTMSMRMAARFCNWLHNGKVNEQWAFDKGVYDTSTFTRNPDGSYNDDYTRAPDARYWIPTADEWLKAVYYDPDRHGPGKGGWWIHPGSSDERLRIEYPENGGQTNGGLWEWYNSRLPAGMYPDVRTPWGLLDASGGASEHTTDGYSFGSSCLDDMLFVHHYDRAGQPHNSNGGRPDRGFLDGLRLAKPVRTPGK